MITNTTQVYELINLIITTGENNGLHSVAQELTKALHLSSSGLEILGAIKQILTLNYTELEKIVSRQILDEIISFIDNCFGS